jgi:hypothetical protein
VQRPQAAGGSPQEQQELKQEVINNYERIENRTHCDEVDIDVRENSGQTNMVVVCGPVANGDISTSNNRSEGDLLLTGGAK